MSDWLKYNRDSKMGQGIPVSGVISVIGPNFLHFCKFDQLNVMASLIKTAGKTMKRKFSKILQSVKSIKSHKS